MASDATSSLVPIEVVGLLSVGFQQVSSDSGVSPRSVRRTKLRWIHGATRECTAKRLCLARKASTSPGDPDTARRRDTEFVTAFATCPSDKSPPEAVRARYRGGDVAVHGTRLSLCASATYGGFAELVVPRASRKPATEDSRLIVDTQQPTTRISRGRYATVAGERSKQ